MSPYNQSLNRNQLMIFPGSLNVFSSPVLDVDAACSAEAANPSVLSKYPHLIIQVQISGPAGVLWISLCTAIRFLRMAFLVSRRARFSMVERSSYSSLLITVSCSRLMMLIPICWDPVSTPMLIPAGCAHPVLYFKRMVNG